MLTDDEVLLEALAHRSSAGEVSAQLGESAWAGYALNGSNSLVSLRARIRLLEEDPPVAELTGDLLGVNENAVNPGTRRTALRAAVRSGTAGSLAVRSRVEALLARADAETAPVEHALLSGLLAQWWWRSCVALEEATDAAAADWQAAEAAALAAAQLLRRRGVSLDPSLEIDMWRTAADAAQRTVPAADRERVELERLLAAVLAAAELMTTVSTTTTRAVHARRFAPLFARAAALAARLGDHAAADTVMEAARRDRVGLILAEIARNPDVDVAIRSAALAVSQASAHTPTEPEHAAPEEEEGATNAPATSAEEGGARGLDTRSAAIATDRVGAVRGVEQVLGPLGALCDAGRLSEATGAALLDALAGTGTTAVLSLLPLAGADTDAEVPVLRRLTWQAPGEEVREHLDLVTVHPDILGLAAGGHAMFAVLADITGELLPPPLLALLATADETAPVRLAVVPTGFFHVPFDALNLDSVVPGARLLDRAAVSLHGSLTSALALLRLERDPSLTPSVAVYDEALTHALSEYEGLLQYFPGVERVPDADGLHDRLATRHPRAAVYSLLVMGVHGVTDATGWAQAKRMPDGSVITAAQVFSWTVPRLCVLASCHSAITTADGVELGGFPLALMLRGATTVVGGLYDIDDGSTAHIMVGFWQRLAGGLPPVRALREAKLAWLVEDSSRRRDAKLWAGLVAYGATAGG